MSTKPGRPYDERLDAAIADATTALLTESGYAALTIDAVARRAGTTRTALYRRHRGRGSLVVAVLVARFGLDPAPATGDLRADLEALQAQQLAFFTDPVVEAAISGVLSDIAGDEALRREFHERFLAPRRASVAAMLARADPPVRPEPPPAVVSDLLTGPLLLRATLPGTGRPDAALAATTVDAVLAVLRG